MCSTPPRCTAISPCAAPRTARRCSRSTARPTRSTQGICVIADEKGVESLAGIMGGEATGCSETTTDVLIESALWDELNIAQTGRKLGINSDARYRFERGVDPAFMLPGLELATQMVLDLCGGTPSEIVVAGDPTPKETIIDFPLSELQRLAGLEAAARRRAPRAGEARLLRRRPRRAREDRGAVVAAGRARPGRHRRGTRAHRRRRPGAVDAVPARRRRAQAGADADPEPHPQGQARARRARPGRGRHLVVRLQARGRAVRRRQARSWRSPIRSPPTSPTCGRASFPGLVDGGAAQRRPRLSPTWRCSRSGRSSRATSPRTSSPPPAACAARSPRPPASAATGRARPSRSTPSTPRPTPSPCWRRPARRCRRLQVVPGGPAWLHPGRTGTIQIGPQNVLGYFGELHPRALEALKAEGPLVAFEVILENIPEPKAKPTRAKPAARAVAVPAGRARFRLRGREQREGRRHRARRAERRHEADRQRHRVRRLRGQGHRPRQEVDRHRRDHAAAREDHDRCRRSTRSASKIVAEVAQENRRRVAGVRRQHRSFPRKRESSLGPRFRGDERRVLPRQQIRIRKSVALDRLSDPDRNVARQHRPGRHEGMEFAVLAAGVNAGGQRVDQCSIEAAAGERAPAPSSDRPWPDALRRRPRSFRAPAPRSAAAITETPASRRCP